MLRLRNWRRGCRHQIPPWAATRALLAYGLVALDKQPGTQPVGIGETYQQLIAKCVILLVAGVHATQACENYNLYAGLNGGIEGAVHVVQVEWNCPGNHGIPNKQIQGGGPGTDGSGTAKRSLLGLSLSPSL